MALTDYFEPFIRMDRRSTPDGMGGFDGEWLEGEPFEAGISTLSSREAQIAYQAGTQTIFTIVTSKTVRLEQTDTVKRVKDGRLYGITGNAGDMETPNAAEMQFWQVTAEVMEV